MYKKPDKDTEVDSLLSSIFSSQTQLINQNSSKNNFLLKYFKPLVISFIALLFTATGALATKNIVLPYFFEEKPVKKTMEMEEDVPILKSEDKPEAEILGVTDEQKATPTTDVKKTADDLKIILPSPTSSIFNPTVNDPQSPIPVINQQPKTYSIIPISTMSIASMEPNLQTIAYSAYQEFLGTANLNQLDQSTQVQILVDIYSRMLKEDIAETQQNIIQLKQELQPTAVPEVLYVNLEIEAKLDELRQTLNTIRNQAVPMNVIEGRKQRAYQDWMLNNSAIHPIIIGSRYANDLNSILIIYGL